MIFEIYIRSSDTCGNTDYTHLGYVELPNEEAAKKRFPPGFLIALEARPIKLSTVEDMKKEYVRRLSNRNYR